jgi:tripartite-type tricarboxylate transporter receptor subunit TctC
MIRIVIGALLALVGVAGAGYAQSWPTKPVKVVVPITAGSAIDIVARAASQQLAKELGQPFVIENRPGAGTTLGAGVVANSPPDGYTILITSAALTTTPATVANLSYDVTRDLIAVLPFTNTPLIMITPPGKYKSLADYVKAAKAARRHEHATVWLRLGVASTSGVCGTTGFGAGRFLPRTPEIMTDIITDRIAFFFSPLTAALPLIAGQGRRLGDHEPHPLVKLPNVPTTAGGLSQFRLHFWSASARLRRRWQSSSACMLRRSRRSPRRVPQGDVHGGEPCRR